MIKSDKHHIIAIEGNIGVGKSTLLPKLADALEYKLILEPADSDPEFARLLKDFTENPTDTEIRIRFQSYITNQRAELLKDLPAGKYLIERSLFSDIVFSQVNMLGMARPSGEYLSYFYDIVDALKDYPKIDGLVYLGCDPKLSYQRMMERGRDSEKGTPFHYIEDLERFHVACIPQICREYHTPLIMVDWGDYGQSIGGVEGLKKLLEERDLV